MKKLNNKGFGAVEFLLIFVVIGIIGGAGYYVYNAQKKTNTALDNAANTQVDPQKNTSNKEKETAKTVPPYDPGNFGEKGEYGVTQVEGYGTVEKVDDGVCMMMEDTSGCEKVDYVFFNITKSENDKFNQYIKGLEGNSFVGVNAVGVGCYVDKKIKYGNTSDAKGNSSYETSAVDTGKILAATKENPIRLEIERLEYTTGRDAPACYSHFATFKIVP